MNAGPAATGAPSWWARTASGLGRLWYGAFMLQRWTLGIAPDADLTDAKWIEQGRLMRPLPWGDFLADPFLVPGTGGRVVLCEWLQTRLGRGVIARAELDERGELSELSTLIDWAPYHLSYPHVFRHEGELYVCPEACYSRRVTLFRLSPDARTVLDSHVALEGFAAVDPTLFEYEGRWWLFCTDAEGGHSNTHLHAFHAPSPRGPWTPHRANPIVQDVSAARPAGRVFVQDGKLFRPAQQSSLRYGGGLRLFEIERLTPDEFRQTLRWDIAPPVGEHGQHGVHTVNRCDGRIIYDAYTERFSPFAGLYRLRERYR